MKLILFVFVLILSTVVQAARNPHYKNLQYLPLETQAEACKALLSDPSRESIECLYFEHSVKTAREAGSGLAEGRRSSARLALKPEFPELAARVAALVQKGQTAQAQRAWKQYLQKMAQIPYPADVNEVIVWIAREVYIKNDPVFDLRLKEFAGSAETLGLASDKVAEYERLFANCSQIANCDVHEIQEEMVKAKEALQSANSGNEIQMIKLQSAISARGQLIQLIANMLCAFNETTKSIVGNIR